MCTHMYVMYKTGLVWYLTYIISVFFICYKGLCCAVGATRRVLSGFRPVRTVGIQSEKTKDPIYVTIVHLLPPVRVLQKCTTVVFLLSRFVQVLHYVIATYRHHHRHHHHPTTPVYPGPSAIALGHCY